jgi:ketosteroid isomerase-like protein
MNENPITFDNAKPVDLRDAALVPGSQATPFSRFIWAIVEGDIATAQAQITDDIEWGLMPYGKMLVGKDQVVSWLKAAAADRKTPVVISNAATDTWGLFEYWNIGTVSQEVIALGNEQHWPWPGDPRAYLGREYKVAQCFTYHVNRDGKIDFMRQYLDTSSVWTQLT